MNVQEGGRRSCPLAQRQGFTMVEVLITVTIAAVLMIVAIPSAGSFLSKRAVVNARDAFMLSAAGARASAVERGDVVLLVIRPGQDSIVAMSGDGADTLHVLDLARGETRADVLVESVIRVCYVPRGFAHPSCGTGGSLPSAVGFAGRQDTVWTEINAVGQVQRQ